MVINALTMLALYCSRCGKIELHMLSRFTLRHFGERQLVCGCGQEQATITVSGRRDCLLYIPCPVCEVRHVIRLGERMLWQNGVERIYCPEQNFELGFVGDSNAVNRLMAEYRYAAETLFREMDERDGEEDRGNSRVVLETLNKIHDIAEQGGVYCRCGSRDISAEVAADAVKLSCERCGGRRTIAARGDHDLVHLARLHRLEIIPYRLKRRKN
ncbi:MAG TPA: hypothetical protein VN611_11350 [Patescibacteria group bacterium]|nr:hypothetical protein [Patescibacteria group bacterium]